MRQSLFIIIALLIFTLTTNAQEVKKVGDTVNTIQLTSTKGDVYNLNNHKLKGAIVVFMTPSCDHCVAYEKRVSALHETYKKKGFPVVAIGPYGDNEKDYPYDAMLAMKKLAEEKMFSFPYLADEKFKYTWLFEIKQTPKAVILKKLKEGYLVTYIGNIDNEPDEKRVPTMKYVEDEVDELLGKSVQ
ncbi:redoxin domain-containing protein [Pedobacter xixiisoli]|uniref:AhpC/TSA family protein n=1 Tax=Pedobacter xixiisoli TaxID=1476464 RepID=A0A285ZTX5_9SPHI|nr:redoxin domain-containing protein [Pedobacter xixiisoli]SOD13100.1 AhpC/TSA family protein [Pedobacter xixiisoli]